MLPTPADSEHPVDATGHSAWIIPCCRQTEAAVGYDSTPGGIIGESVKDIVYGGHVKRTKKSLSLALCSTFDFDTLGKAGQHFVDPLSRAIGTHNDACMGTVC